MLVVFGSPLSIEPNETGSGSRAYGASWSGVVWISPLAIDLYLYRSSRSSWILQKAKMHRSKADRLSEWCMTYCRNSSLNNSKLLFFFSWAFGIFLDEAELLSFFELLEDDFSEFDARSSSLVCGLYNFPLSRWSSSAKYTENCPLARYGLQRNLQLARTSWSSVISASFDPYFGYAGRCVLKCFYEFFEDLKLSIYKFVYELD